MRPYEAETAARIDNLSRARRDYWRFNVRLIVALLAFGALVSFGVPLVAGQLKSIRFAGWSLPFYMGAQGAIIVYLALVLIYIVAMNGADRRLQQAINMHRGGAASGSGLGPEVTSEGESGKPIDP